MADTDMKAAEAAAAVRKDAAPRLKFTDSGTWISREIDRNISIDEPLSSDGKADTSREWKRHEWLEAASYSRADWKGFIRFAIANGLSGIEESIYKGNSSFELSFSPILPDRLAAGTRTLLLNKSFAAQMRVSPRYPPKVGPNGFVILLHDPHENVGGRAQTLSGLWSLLSTNTAIPFTFLVEGAYHDPSRKIGFAGLDVALKKNADTTPAVVYSLLNHYLINTPMAYRLLYDRQISATAIDDNNALKYNAPRPTRTISQQISALAKLEDEVESSDFPKEAAHAKDNVRGMIRMAYVYLIADVRDVSDDQFVGYFTSVAKYFRAISSAARLLSQAGLKVSSSEAQAFAADAAGYGDEAAIYQMALDRNKTMIPNIIAGARNQTQALPITFIGSFHTHGILAALQAAGIGYVVIEPRPRRRATETESRAFERAIHPDTRSSYLTRVSINMGGVAPTPVEVTQFYRPKIATKTLQIRADRAASAAQINSVPGAALDVRKLNQMADRNPSLADVRFADGSKSPPPPGNLGGGFAFFEGPDGKTPNSKPRLVLTDARDKRWSDDDRYEFLASAVFEVPPDGGDLSTGFLLSLYPGDADNRVFLTYYEPKTKRIYCFEGDTEKIASIIPASLASKDGDEDIRTQVTQIWILVKASHG
jgi:hypothetical protein